MRIENILWLLKEIKRGNTTLYSLSKIKDVGNVNRFLRYALKYEFIKKSEEERKKPYTLTDKGETFLKLFQNKKQ